MANIFAIKLDTSVVIALLALVLAGLSALYAHWSWREARKANQIAMFGYKKEIYDAFFELRMHMLQNAESAKMAEVSKFEAASRNAKIYFPAALADDIKKYFDACFSIADIHRKYCSISKESMVECEQHIAAECAFATKIEEELGNLLKEAQAWHVGQ